MVYFSYWFLIIVCIWVSGKRLGIWKLLRGIINGVLWTIAKTVGLVSPDTPIPNINQNSDGF
jgi:hypothetical protein